ncbi:hypothetical protein SNEBB_000734 [Seison nebaliae]|nr:hypothetical protein SNEBB_000734 [Seison nebaliae]
MAEHLAAIFGTEKDKVNCSFFFKIGACRHGMKCARIHNIPAFSSSILMKNLFINHNIQVNHKESTIQQQKEFNQFYQELFEEISKKYGEIVELNVCNNLGEHLNGNAYVKFRDESDALTAVNELNKRWFDGNVIYAELSPVTDFGEACCRQYELNQCDRGKLFKNQQRRYNRRRRHNDKKRKHIPDNYFGNSGGKCSRLSTYHHYH